MGKKKVRVEALSSMTFFGVLFFARVCSEEFLERYKERGTKKCMEKMFGKAFFVLNRFTALHLYNIIFVLLHDSLFILVHRPR